MDKLVEKKEKGLAFDVSKLNLSSLFRDISDLELPAYFYNQIMQDTEDDLSKWDGLTRNCIRIGRTKGFIAAWNYVVSKEASNHVIITGRSYVGKTTAGLALALQLSQMYNQTFDERNVLGGRAVVLSPELIKIIFDHIKNFKNFIIFIDEVQHALNRLRATAKANLEGNLFYDAIRKLGIHTFLTTPLKDSVDKSIVEFKINWWVNCYDINDEKRYVCALIYFNGCTWDGKEWDWVPISHVIIKWVNSKLYFAVTERISHKKIYSVDGLEDYDKRFRELAEEGKEEARVERIVEIMKKPISPARKAFLMYDVKGITETAIMANTGLSYKNLKDVYWQKKRGVKEKDIKIKKSRGRAKDSST